MVDKKDVDRMTKLLEDAGTLNDLGPQTNPIVKKGVQDDEVKNLLGDLTDESIEKLLKAMKKGKKTEDLDETVTHRGWTIEPHDGVHVGYKNPNSKSLKQQLGFNTHKKIKGYTLSHPEHGKDIKHVSTIAHAKKYIDDYEGKSENLSTTTFDEFSKATEKDYKGLGVDPKKKHVKECPNCKGYGRIGMSDTKCGQCFGKGLVADNSKSEHLSTAVFDEALNEDRMIDPSGSGNPNMQMILSTPQAQLLTVVSNPLDGELFYAVGIYAHPVDSFRERAHSPLYRWDRLVGVKAYTAIKSVANFDSWAPGEYGVFKIGTDGNARKMSESEVNESIVQSGSKTITHKAKSGSGNGRCTKCGAYATQTYGKWTKVSTEHDKHESACEHNFVLVESVEEIRKKNPNKTVHDVGTKVRGPKSWLDPNKERQERENANRPIGTVTKVEDHGAGMIAHYVMWPKKRKATLHWGHTLEKVSESKLSTSVFDEFTSGEIDEKKYMMTYAEPWDKDGEHSGGQKLHSKTQSDAEVEAKNIAAAHKIPHHNVTTKKKWKQGVVDSARRAGAHETYDDGEDDEYERRAKDARESGHPPVDIKGMLKKVAKNFGKSLTSPDSRVIH